MPLKQDLLNLILVVDFKCVYIVRLGNGFHIHICETPINYGTLSRKDSDHGHHFVQNCDKCWPMFFLCQYAECV